MTTDIASTVVRISSPSDVVDAVPYLLGFQPENSLVVLSMRGERNRLGLSARVDLPAAAAADRCARLFVRYLKRDEAEGAVIVLYPPSGGPSHDSVQPLTEALTKRLVRAGIDVCQVLCVSEGRWWSLHCMDADCCPPEGTPLDPANASACAAALTVNGLVVLASREELARTLDPLVGVVHAAMSYALPHADVALTNQIAAGRHAEVAAETVELFRAAVCQRLDADRSDVTGLGVDVAARLILGLVDVSARDEVLTWFDGDWGDATRGLLVDLVRRAVAPYQVPPLTVLGWLCYLQGNGTLAGIAIDRALAADPDYALAQLLDRALLGALNPELFQTALRAGRNRYEKDPLD